MALAVLMVQDEVLFDCLSLGMVRTFDRHTTGAGESPALTADLAIPSEQVSDMLSSLSVLIFPWWVVGS